MRARAEHLTAYDEDLYAWTRAQAALLRARQSNGLDWDNLAQEIEALGGRDRRELESRLCVILLHLLKWQAQPGIRGVSWRKTLRTQRREIRKLLRQSPSLAREVPELMRDAYPDAVKDAVDETGLPVDHFPAGCPYTPEEALDERFLPTTSF